jgi:CRP/FNR family transcriptional regulator, cyclic AMP receptor protein
LVLDALHGEWQQTRERVVYLIGFLGFVDMDLPVWDALVTFNLARYAYALELLETRLPPEIKRLVFPLLELQSIHQGKAYDALLANFPQERRSRESRFQEIIRGASPSVSSWTRDFARYSLNTQKDILMQTIEKVLILKTVDLFNGIPGNVLAEIAQLLEEVEVPTGQSIVRQGEYGDSMYIVISGKMRVHDGDNFLNYLGPRTAFGEMALLDSEPRVATVTADEDTRLFRLNQTPFYELMADYPQLTRGIIRVLSGHLRSRVKDMKQLQEQISGKQAKKEA